MNSKMNKKRLHDKAQKRAVSFLRVDARPLDWARYQYHFVDGDAERVLVELASFVNVDGGFGNALEPDLRMTDSSVVATTVALQILREVQAPSHHILVTNAMKYLLQTFDPAGMVWPIVPPNTGDAPHAPWWNYSENVVSNWNGFLGNPRPEILGYLYDYAPSGLPAWVREHLTRAVIRYLDEQVDKVNMFDLMCYNRLVRTRALPEDIRQNLLERLRPLAKKLVETDSLQWEKYGLEPIELVDSAASPFADMFTDILEQNLDVEIERQADDGGWYPSWSWPGNAYPDVWPIAKQESAGFLTLRALLLLRAFGRLAEDES